MRNPSSLAFPVRPTSVARVALVALVAMLLSACGGSEFHEARGVVQEVVAEHGQVVIDHEDIPDFMPAMTMNFDVPDPALLEQMAPGQRIRFVIEYDRRSYKIVEMELIDPGEGADAGPAADRARIANLARNATPAPGFELVDQAGEPLSMADLRGRALLLDFIFTSCSGPCPILTGIHAAAQRALDPTLRDRVRFVSISIDPERDTPEALRAYAEERGANLDNWSFLTGEPAAVAAVMKGFGVGSSPAADGQIDHILVTFLIDGDGRIVKRYVGVDHDPETLSRDLAAVASLANAS